MAENTLNIYEQKAEEMTATHIISPGDKFSQTDGGFISLDYEGKHYDRVKVVRLFPFTDANKYLSIREYGGASCDTEIGNCHRAVTFWVSDDAPYNNDEMQRLFTRERKETPDF